jgi:hypothetical protein
MKTNLWKDVYQYILGALIVLSFLAIIVLTIIYKPPDNQVLNTLIGAFTAGVIMVITYFYGSSKGSADKNELLKSNGNGKIT